MSVTRLSDRSVQPPAPTDEVAVPLHDDIVQNLAAALLFVGLLQQHSEPTDTPLLEELCRTLQAAYHAGCGLLASIDVAHYGTTARPVYGAQ